MKNNLIEKKFRSCATEGRPALIAYVTAGDPDFDTSIKVVETLAEAGTDIIELGVPFSDPLADGDANQKAAVRALKSGMTAWKVIEAAAEIRKKYPELPLVLFTYLNPVAHSGGFEKYCRGAAAAGINAFLPLDLPPEEYENYRRTIDDSGIKVINLIAPTTKKERIRLLCESSNAFIYYVCREGVTGERKDFASGVDRKIATIKKHTSLPVAVGFGISTPEQVKAASSAGADGVIVGSAIVRKVEALSKGKGTLDDIKTFVRSLRQALN